MSGFKKRYNTVFGEQNTTPQNRQNSTTNTQIPNQNFHQDGAGGQQSHTPQQGFNQNTNLQPAPQASFGHPPNQAVNPTQMSGQAPAWQQGVNQGVNQAHPHPNQHFQGQLQGQQFAPQDVVPPMGQSYGVPQGYSVPQGFNAPSPRTQDFGGQRPNSHQFGQQGFGNGHAFDNRDVQPALKKKSVLFEDNEPNPFTFYDDKENWIYLWAERSPQRQNANDDDKLFKSQELFDYRHTHGKDAKDSSNAFMGLGSYHGDYSKDAKYDVRMDDFHIQFYDKGELKVLSGFDAFEHLAQNSKLKEGQKGLITNKSSAMAKVMKDNYSANVFPRMTADLNVLSNAGLVDSSILDKDIDSLPAVWEHSSRYAQTVTGRDKPLFTLSVHQQTLKYTTEVAKMGASPCLTIDNIEFLKQDYHNRAQQDLKSAMDMVMEDFYRVQLKVQAQYGEHGAQIRPLKAMYNGTIPQGDRDIATIEHEFSVFLNNGTGTLLGETYNNKKGNRVFKNDGSPLHQFIQEHLPPQVLEAIQKKGLVGKFSQKDSPKSRLIKSWSKEKDLFGLSEADAEMMEVIQKFIKLKESYHTNSKVTRELNNLSHMMNGKQAFHIVQNAQGTATGRQTGLNQKVNILGLNKITKGLITLANQYKDREIFNADVKGLEMVITNCVIGNVEGHELYCKGGDNYLKTGLDIAMNTRQEMWVGNQKYKFSDIINHQQLFDEKLKTLNANPEKVQAYAMICEQDPNSFPAKRARLDIMYDYANMVRKQDNHPDLDDIEQIRKVGKVASLMMNYGAGARLIAEKWDMDEEEVTEVRKAYDKCMDGRIKQIHYSLEDLLQRVASGEQVHADVLKAKAITNKLDVDFMNGTHEAPTLVAFSQNKENPRDLRLNYVGGGYMILKDLQKDGDSVTYMSEEGERKKVYGAQLFSFCIQGTGARCMQNQDVSITHALTQHGILGEDPKSRNRVLKGLDIHDSKAYILPEDETLKQASIMLINQVMAEGGAGFERTFSHFSHDENGNRKAEVSTNRMGKVTVFKTDVDIGKGLESQRTATHKQFMNGELEDSLLTKTDNTGNEVFKFRQNTHLINFQGQVFDKEGQPLAQKPEQEAVVLMGSQRDLTHKQSIKEMMKMVKEVSNKQDSVMTQESAVTKEQTAPEVAHHTNEQVAHNANEQVAPSQEQPQTPPKKPIRGAHPIL